MNFHTAQDTFEPTDIHRLRIVHSTGEIQALETDAQRLTREIREMSEQIRHVRQHLSGLLTLRENKAQALEAKMRALARRLP